MKKKELEKKLAVLGDIEDEAKKRIVCALIGHSLIVTNCMGYVHCARCEEQLGDTLARIYDDSDNVIVDHECDTCRTNWGKLTWIDKYMVEYKMPPV